ncbi:MAG: phosphoglycerate kinase [Candidatus Uhrbacteria bacterium]
MRLHRLSDLGDLSGKCVIVRCDLNVPMEKGRIAEDTKIRAAAETIRALRKDGASCVLCSHLGEGKASETLRPVATRFSRVLSGTRVSFTDFRIGSEQLQRRLKRMKPGDVLLLENLRHYAGEQSNDPKFAAQLAACGDVYVNDAFAVSHRSHASVVAIVGLLPSAAGLLVEREIDALERVTDKARPPFIVLLGGAKIITKVPVIKKLLGMADSVLLGGAVAQHFLVAQGYDVGGSLIDAEGVSAARQILRTQKQRNLTLPIDVVTGDPKGKRKEIRIVRIGPRPHEICPKNMSILDIGPMTIQAYAQQLRSAATLLWNGPMGQFERAPFHHGSVMLARVIASRASGRAYGVVGGGETLEVLAKTHMAKYIDHASTGGGAMLAFIAGERMPALEALRVK